MKYHHILRKDPNLYIQYVNICFVHSLILHCNFFRIFEQEVRSQSSNVVSDAEMDTLLKSKLLNWLQQRVYNYFIKIFHVYKSRFS